MSYSALYSLNGIFVYHRMEFLRTTPACYRAPDISRPSHRHLTETRCDRDRIAGHKQGPRGRQRCRHILNCGSGGPAAPRIGFARRIGGLGGSHTALAGPLSPCGPAPTHQPDTTRRQHKAPMAQQPHGAGYGRTTTLTAGAEGPRLRERMSRRRIPLARLIRVTLVSEAPMRLASTLVGRSVGAAQAGGRCQDSRGVSQ